MAKILMRVVGCGDAFGTGGLHATCFYFETSGLRFLIDIGAGALPGLKQMDIEPNTIDAIFISHFHGDHFGGLPNFLLDAKFVQARKKALTIAGPSELSKHIWGLQEAMYGGTSTMDFDFPINFAEYQNDISINVAPSLKVRAIPVVHSEASKPHALKVEILDKAIVYTGDTEWTDKLMDLSSECDLLISECFGWEGPMKFHLSYKEINAKAEMLNAKRMVLTHLGPEAFARLEEMQLTVLQPEMEIEI